MTTMTWSDFQRPPMTADERASWRKEKKEKLRAHQEKEHKRLLIYRAEKIAQIERHILDLKKQIATSQAHIKRIKRANALAIKSAASSSTEG
jgi:hypothetical protein